MSYSGHSLIALASVAGHDIRKAVHLCLSVFICVGLLLASTELAAQSLFKCTTPAGKVVYQQDKCDETHKQSTVRPPDPVAEKSEAELKASSARDAKAIEQQMAPISQAVADLTVCGDVPGWDEKHGAAIRDWRSRNGQAIAKLDQDQDARGKAVARVQSERTKYATDKSGLMDRCESFAASLRKTTNQKN